VVEEGVEHLGSIPVRFERSLEFLGEPIILDP
jgi:hypothetical protein